MIDDTADAILHGAHLGTDTDDATRATAYCRARLDGDALGEVRRDWFGIRRHREARERAEHARREAHEAAWMTFWGAMHAAMPNPTATEEDDRG